MVRDRAAYIIDERVDENGKTFFRVRRDTPLGLLGVYSTNTREKAEQWVRSKTIKARLKSSGLY